MELSDKIRIAREKQHLTKTELARKIGVRSAAVVSAWESGISQPSTMTTIRNLCTTLNINLYDLFGMQPSEENVLSSYQSEILSKTEFLDVPAYQRIMAVIDEEYKRCYASSASDIAPSQLNVSLPIFLERTDPDYEDIKAKMCILKKSRKKKGFSASSITHFLWMAGFNGYISIAQVCAIFAGVLVPSKQLYNCLYSYIEGTYKKTLEEFFNQING